MGLLIISLTGNFLALHLAHDSINYHRSTW